MLFAPHKIKEINHLPGVLYFPFWSCGASVVFFLYAPPGSWPP